MYRQILIFVKTLLSAYENIPEERASVSPLAAEPMSTI